MNRSYLATTASLLLLATQGCLLNPDKAAEQTFADRVNGVEEDMSSSGNMDMGGEDMEAPEDMGSIEDMSPEEDMPEELTCDNAGANFCNGHGVCEDGETISCSCEAAYAGDNCELCNSGYTRTGDDSCGPLCDTLDCGTHGVCMLVDGETPDCKCEEGYSGDSCETCAPGYKDNDGDGVCVADCDASSCQGPNESCQLSDMDMIECVCDGGYARAGVSEDCTTCEAGYQDNDGDGICKEDCETANISCAPPEQCSDESGSVVCKLYPSTCAELKAQLMPADQIDDFYELYFGNDPAKPWVAFCKDLGGALPGSYLPLSNTTGDGNAFTQVQEVGPSAESPQFTTRYRMVRIVPNGPTGAFIALGDNFFANTTYYDRAAANDPSGSEMSDEFMLFGTVATYASGQQDTPDLSRVTPDNSKATLDLRNTGFKPVTPMFKAYGNFRYCNPQMAMTGSVGLLASGAAFELEVTRQSSLGPASVQVNRGLRCDDPTFTNTSDMPNAPLTLEIAYDAPPSATPLTHPISCKEAQAIDVRMGVTPQDGDYMLYANRNPLAPWTAYCENMNTARPVTYLTLPRQMNGSNTFGIAYSNAGTQAIDGIQYQRIEIDPHTLEVNISNKEHTNRITVQTAIPEAELPDYGTLEVRDDRTYAVTGKVDLRDTPFKLADSPLGLTALPNAGAIFGPNDCDAVMTESLSEGDRVADLTLTSNPNLTSTFTSTAASPNRRALYQGAPLTPPSQECYQKRPYLMYSSESDYVLRLEYAP